MTKTQRMRVDVPVILSLGSNLGDREETIRDAVRDISAIDGVRVVAASGLVESPAVKPDGVDLAEPAYLNAVIAIRTARSPRGLLRELNAIEARHGRARDERWANRTLDIDIVTYDRLEKQSEALTLPHPRAADRGFVLAPWLEIEPDAELPGYGRVDRLLAETSDDVRPYPAEELL